MGDDASEVNGARAYRISLWHVLSAGVLQFVLIPLLLMPYGRWGEVSSYSESCALIHSGILLIIFFMRLRTKTSTSVWDVIYVYVGPVLPAVAGIIASIIRDGR